MKRILSMTMQKQTRYIIVAVALLLLSIAVVYQRGSDEQNILSLLQKAEPDVEQYNEVKGSYPTYELFDGDGRFLNYAVISSASGYGGEIRMLTTVNKVGTINRVVLLDHAETPIYLNKVLKSGYLENLQDKSISNPLKSYDGLDAVSGATRTTEGILSAVSKGVSQIGENQLGMASPIEEGIHFVWQDGLVILIVFVACLASVKKIKKLRTWLLVASVIVIGFLTKQSLTLGNFMSILTGNMPAFAERPIWFIFVIGIVIVTLVFGKNIYCSWICPFGAAQEGIYKALNLKTYKVDPRIIAIAKKSVWFFIWLAAMLALIFNNPGSSSYEPFSVFFGGEGVKSQWIIMGIVVIMSILVYRLWCRMFCPVGTVLDLVAKGKRKSKKLLKNKPTIQVEFVHGENPMCTSCSNCEAACGVKRKKENKPESLSTFNKILVCIILLIDILIVGVLLQNIGLI